MPLMSGSAGVAAISFRLPFTRTWPSVSCAPAAKVQTTGNGSKRLAVDRDHVLHEPLRPARSKVELRPLEALGIRKFEQSREGVVVRDTVPGPREVPEERLTWAPEKHQVGACPVAAGHANQRDHEHSWRIALPVR